MILIFFRQFQILFVPWLIEETDDTNLSLGNLTDFLRHYTSERMIQNFLRNLTDFLRGYTSEQMIQISLGNLTHVHRATSLLF